MRLSTLHEARLANRDPKTQVFARVFEAVKKWNSKVSINDIAQYSAAIKADLIYGDYTHAQMIELAFEGLPTLKDNPQAINDALMYFFDAETGEDFDSLVDSIISFLDNNSQL